MPIIRDAHLPAASTATVTAVASETTNQTALAANNDRKGAIFYNSDANAAFVKFGTTASSTDFTVAIAANASWSMPAPVYTGRIDVIWGTAGTGSLHVTEL